MKSISSKNISNITTNFSISFLLTDNIISSLRLINNLPSSILIYFLPIKTVFINEIIVVAKIIINKTRGAIKVVSKYKNITAKQQHSKYFF